MSEVGILFAPVQSILTDNLGMQDVSKTKFFLRIVFYDQKENHLQITFNIPEYANTEFMKNITGDETWVMTRYKDIFSRHREKAL